MAGRGPSSPARWSQWWGASAHGPPSGSTSKGAESDSPADSVSLLIFPRPHTLLPQSTVLFLMTLSPSKHPEFHLCLLTMTASCNRSRHRSVQFQIPLTTMQATHPPKLLPPNSRYSSAGTLPSPHVQVLQTHAYLRKKSQLILISREKTSLQSQFQGGNTKTHCTQISAPDFRWLLHPLKFPPACPADVTDPSLSLPSTAHCHLKQFHTGDLTLITPHPWDRMTPSFL